MVHFIVLLTSGSIFLFISAFPRQSIVSNVLLSLSTFLLLLINFTPLPFSDGQCLRVGACTDIVHLKHRYIIIIIIIIIRP